MPGTIGTALRTARMTKGMSLTDVATTAGVSAATLSRIETDKQGVDVDMLMTLSRVLHVSPADMLDEAHQAPSSEETLVNALAALTSDERTRIVMAAAKRRTKRGPGEPLHAQLDALLTTIDLLRDELTTLRQQPQASHRRRR